MTRTEAITKAEEYAEKTRMTSGWAVVYRNEDGTHGVLCGHPHVKDLPEGAFYDVIVTHRNIQRTAGSRSLHTPAGHRAGAPDLGYNRIHGVHYALADR